MFTGNEQLHLLLLLTFLFQNAVIFFSQTLALYDKTLGSNNIFYSDFGEKKTELSPYVYKTTIVFFTVFCLRIVTNNKKKSLCHYYATLARVIDFLTVYMCMYIKHKYKE